MAKASSMRWRGHVLRNEDKNVMVKALKFEMRVVEEDDRNKGKKRV